MTFISIMDDQFDYAGHLETDCAGIIEKLKLTQDTSGMIIFAVAVNRSPSNNRVIAIPIDDGEPINIEVHNLVKDTYEVLGEAYHRIGFLPVNYELSLPEANWSASIPLPFVVIERYMNEDQKADFEAWKANFSDEKYEFKFVQTVYVF